MNKAADTRSGLPLLLIYTILVVAGALVATGGYFSVGRMAPGYGDIALVVLLIMTIVGMWPIAEWLEDRLAARNAGVAEVALARSAGKRPV